MDTVLPRKIGVRPFIKPAFLRISPIQKGGEDSLVVTSFGLFGEDSVRHLPGLAHQLGGDSFRNAPIKDLSRKINWPNGAKLAPPGMFQEESLVVAGGFLPPGRATGAITVMPTQDGGREKVITTPKRGWFYHQVEFHDMNGDGRQDIVTARAHKPLFGKSGGEMVWLENPGEQGEWKEHPITAGPDVHFLMADLNRDGQKEILATQFFSKKLSLYWQEEGQWKGRDLDSQLGSPFDLELSDINNDGKIDLLVTNHEADSKAGVFAYEIPSDPVQDEWKRHTLYQGFETTRPGRFQASPGSATAFHPNQREDDLKPSILVSGDGTQSAHILTPLSQDPEDWRYEQKVLIETGSTVGQCVVKDVYGDGYAEIFVPAYDADLIYAFTYAPKAHASGESRHEKAGATDCPNRPNRDHSTPILHL